MTHLNPDIYQSPEFEQFARRYWGLAKIKYPFSADDKDRYRGLAKFEKENPELLKKIIEKFDPKTLYFIEDGYGETILYLPQTCRDNFPEYADYLRKGEISGRASICQHPGHVGYTLKINRTTPEKGVHVHLPNEGGYLQGSKDPYMGVFRTQLGFALDSNSTHSYHTIGIVSLTQRRAQVARVDYDAAQLGVDLPAFSYAGGRSEEHGDENSQLTNCALFSHRMLSKLGFEGIPKTNNSFSLGTLYRDRLNDAALTEAEPANLVSRRTITVDISRYFEFSFDSKQVDNKSLFLVPVTFRTVALENGDYMTVVDTSQVDDRLKTMYKSHGITNRPLQTNELWELLAENGLGVENGKLIDHNINSLREVRSIGTAPASDLEFPIIVRPRSP